MEQETGEELILGAHTDKEKDDDPLVRIRDTILASVLELGGHTFRAALDLAADDNTEGLNEVQFLRMIRDVLQLDPESISDDDASMLFHTLDISQRGDISLSDLRKLAKPGAYLGRELIQSERDTAEAVMWCMLYEANKVDNYSIKTVSTDLVSAIREIINDCESALSSSEQSTKRHHREATITQSEDMKDIIQFPHRSIPDSRLVDMAHFITKYCPMQSGYSASMAMIKLHIIGNAIRKILLTLGSSQDSGEDNLERAMRLSYDFYERKKKTCLNAANLVARPQRRRKRRNLQQVRARDVLVNGSQSISFAFQNINAPAIGSPDRLIRGISVENFLSRDLEASKVARELANSQKWWLISEQEQEEQKKVSSILQLMQGDETPATEKQATLDMQDTQLTKAMTTGNMETCSPAAKEPQHFRSIASARMNKWLNDIDDERVARSRETTRKKINRSHQLVYDKKFGHHKVPAARLYKIRKESRREPRRLLQYTLAIGGEFPGQI